MGWPRLSWNWVFWLAMVAVVAVAIFVQWNAPAEPRPDPVLDTSDGFWRGDVQRFVASAAVLLGILALERAVVGVGKIARAQLVGGDSAFGDGLGALIFGVALAIAATCLGSTAGLGRELDGVWRSEWLANNFEIQLAILSALLVIFADWVGRSWVAAGPGTERAQRDFQINVYSTTFAAAVGVIVFVMIGSSVFAARLAQLQVEVPVRAENGEILRREPMGMERVQFAANRISEIDNDLRKVRRDHALLRDRRSQWSAMTASYQQDMSEEYRRANATLNHLLRRYPDPEQRFIVFMNRPTTLDVQMVRERIERNLRAQRADADLPQAVVEALDQAANDITLAEREAIPPAIGDALRKTAQLDQQISELQERYHRLLRERTCVIASLAVSMPRTVALVKAPEDADGEDSEEGEASPPPVEDDLAFYDDGALFRCPSQMPSDTVDAERLIDAVLPLRRTWMSEQLAKRTPVALSIELVVIMGALGALLRLASARLRQAFTRPTQPSEAQALNAAHANETTLLTLGLQIVFGMATALALFILLNVTINAASMQITGERQNAENLNPFTMAGLGLLGGFAALNVADWMGELSRRILERKDEEDEEDAEESSSPPRKRPGLPRRRRSQRM